MADYSHSGTVYLHRIIDQCDFGKVHKTWATSELVDGIKLALVFMPQIAQRLTEEQGDSALISLVHEYDEVPFWSQNRP